MKVILVTIILILLSVPTYGQKANVIGKWKFGKGFSSYISYNFDSLGIVVFGSASCYGPHFNTGNFVVEKDSIIITYFPGGFDVNWNYKTDSNKLEREALYILDGHTIQLNEYIFINNIDLPDRITFEDSVFCADQIIETKEIQFDKFNGHLLPESFNLLDSIAYFLNKNSSIALKIERWGYTSKTKGDPILPQMQVELIGDYLEGKGIHRNRLNLFGDELDRNYKLNDKSIGLAKVFNEMHYSIRRELDNQFMMSQTRFRIETINFKD